MIMLLVSAAANVQHIDYKLKPTYLEVREKNITLIRANLPFPVQVDNSDWQFGETFYSMGWLGMLDCAHI